MIATTRRLSPAVVIAGNVSLVGFVDFVVTALVSSGSVVSTPVKVMMVPVVWLPESARAALASAPDVANRQKTCSATLSAVAAVPVPVPFVVDIAVQPAGVETASFELLTISKPKSPDAWPVGHGTLT